MPDLDIESLARRAGVERTRLPHEWDDDAICIYCGFDGAEDWHLNNNLRLMIGDDEFNYRKAQGEFDAGRYCRRREDAAIDAALRRLAEKG